jgi:hypothetical protein
MRTTNFIGLLLALVLICGCGSKMSGSAGADGSTQITPDAVPLALPAPSVYAREMHSGPRQTSYVPADLVRPGEGYASSLSHQRVTATAGGAVFDPAYEGPADPFSGLSYAIYAFGIPGYAGDPSITCVWNSAPPDPQDVYLAVANWGADRWDFFAVDAAGKVVLPNPTNYSTPGGDVLVCVLCMGSSPSELDRLRIGSLPPAATLSAVPAYGFAPFDTTLAAAATDADGTVAGYQWDPEGDGTFGATVAGSELPIQYAAAGTYSPAVRAIDNKGVVGASATVLVNVVAAAQSLNFGLPDGFESIAAATALADGKLLVFGSVKDVDSVKSDVLILRMSPAGVFDFARRWPGIDNQGVSDVTLGPENTVFVCGMDHKPGSGTYVQRWTAEGELLWTKVYAPGSNVSLQALAWSGTQLFVVGDDGLLPTGALLYCLDADGMPLWERKLADGVVRYNFRDVALHYGQPELSIHCCGGTFLDTDGNALYASFDASGACTASSAWGNLTEEESASAIAVSDEAVPATIIAGTVSGGSTIQSFISRPGAAGIVFSEAGLSLSNPSLRRVPAGIWMGLSRTPPSNASFSSIVLQFDSNLQLLTGQLLATNGVGCILRRTAPYADGTLLSGYSRGLPPASLGYAATTAASPNIWTAFTATVANDAVVPVPDMTAAVPYPVETLELNRDAGEGDASMYFLR